MKTFVTFDNSGSVILDPETLDVTPIMGSREAISKLYLLNEDVIVKAPDGKTINAQSGDIVIKFYDENFPNRVIVVKSEEWKANIEAYEIARQKELGNWAKKENSEYSCPDIRECKSIG